MSTETMYDAQLTLGQLSNLIRRDLAQPFTGSLDTRVEALAELCASLSKVDVAQTRLEFAPAFHSGCPELLKG